MKIGILSSGALGATILSELLNTRNVVLVMTDKNSLEIITICKKSNIPYFVGNPRNGKSKEFIATLDIDVLISINYVFLIDGDLINWPSKIAFNLHGSLLPKYRGRTPHVWAIINNESETGITAHLIDNGCDTGNIINQIKIPITKLDTGGTILQKFIKDYRPLIESVLNQLELGTLSTIPQNNQKFSFFGKRTPGDGRINWNWQKERIYNWVRAQSFPYPGAFTFYKKNKLIIDRINYVDTSYRYDMPNGLVISSDPLLVKTPNGVICLVEMRDNNFKIEDGDILN